MNDASKENRRKRDRTYGIENYAMKSLKIKKNIADELTEHANSLDVPFNVWAIKALQERMRRDKARPRKTIH